MQQRYTAYSAPTTNKFDADDEVSCAREDAIASSSEEEEADDGQRLENRNITGDDNGKEGLGVAHDELNYYWA